MPIEGKSKVNGRWPNKTFDSIHEKNCYGNWVLVNGMIESHFDHAYKCHTESVCCDWCGQNYINSKDKHMDHCHITFKFRNILCQQCNLWRNECDNLIKLNDDRFTQGFRWAAVVTRNGKRVFRYRSVDLEKVKEALTKFKQENWFYFPFQDCY